MFFKDWLLPNPVRPSDRELFPLIVRKAITRRFGLDPASDWTLGHPVKIGNTLGNFHSATDWLLLGKQMDFLLYRTWLFETIYGSILKLKNADALKRQTKLYDQIYRQFFSASNGPAFVWVNEVWRHWGDLPNTNLPAVRTDAASQRAKANQVPRKLDLVIGEGFPDIELPAREIVFAYRNLRDARLMYTVRKKGLDPEHNFALFDREHLEILRNGSQRELMGVPVYSDFRVATLHKSGFVLTTPVIMLATLHDDYPGGSIRYICDRINPHTGELIAWTGMARGFSRMLGDYPWLRELFLNAVNRGVELG